MCSFHFWRVLCTSLENVCFRFFSTRSRVTPTPRSFLHSHSDFSKSYRLTHLGRNVLSRLLEQVFFFSMINIANGLVNNRLVVHLDRRVLRRLCRLEAGTAAFFPRPCRRSAVLHGSQFPVVSPHVTGLDRATQNNGANLGVSGSHFGFVFTTSHGRRPPPHQPAPASRDRQPSGPQRSPSSRERKVSLCSIYTLTCPVLEL